MKRSSFLIAICFLSVAGLYAQDENPFARYGYHVPVATMTNGRFPEFHDRQDVVQIGSVLFNARADTISGDIAMDTTVMWLEAQTVSRFITIDPLAEKYYHISPYAYCANNPIRYIDPDGQSYGDFLDKKGRLIGNDGLDDGKIYVLKSTTDTKEATDFITKNSGDAKAFQGDNGKIAYNNSIEIEGSATARQAMVTEVSRDNGRGGTKDVNNREYGGSVLNGVVIPAEPGPVSNLQTDTKAEISLPIGVSTFHSHPSGT